jgi:hypothetical protein
VALIGLATQGATAGAGYLTTRALLEGQGELPGVYTLLKFCATWISAWSGVPAGVFAPSLAIGAGIGHDVALLMGMNKEAAIPLIAMGMAGFLAATTGGPITAFIIVMEMVSGQAMVLSLMACALLSSGVARLVTRPMYQELADLLPCRPPPSPGGRRREPRSRAAVPWLRARLEAMARAQAASPPSSCPSAAARLQPAVAAEGLRDGGDSGAQRGRPHRRRGAACAGRPGHGRSDRGRRQFHRRHRPLARQAGAEVITSTMLGKGASMRDGVGGAVRAGRLPGRRPVGLRPAS